MISAEDAKKLSFDSQEQLAKEAEKDLDAAIRAAIAVNKREVMMHKDYSVLIIMRDLAAEYGYVHKLHNNQFDSPSLEITW